MGTQAPRGPQIELVGLLFNPSVACGIFTYKHRNRSAFEALYPCPHLAVSFRRRPATPVDSGWIGACWLPGVGQDKKVFVLA